VTSDNVEVTIGNNEFDDDSEGYDSPLRSESENVNEEDLNNFNDYMSEKMTLNSNSSEQPVSVKGKSPRMTRAQLDPSKIMQFLQTVQTNTDNQGMETNFIFTQSEAENPTVIKPASSNVDEKKFVSIISPLKIKAFSNNNVSRTPKNENSTEEFKSLNMNRSNIPFSSNGQSEDFKKTNSTDLSDTEIKPSNLKPVKPPKSLSPLANKPLLATTEKPPTPPPPPSLVNNSTS
jgi:hypothetical protein